MALVQLTLAIYVSFAVYGVILCQAPDDINNLCIGCICEAATQCNTSASCKNEMCGPFGITRPYWLDAGSPILELDVIENPDAWRNCVRDPQCAGQVVYNYMNRFKKDCNGDGRIDCTDYAQIHHLGGYGCGTRDLDLKYKKQFENCMSSVQGLNGR